MTDPQHSDADEAEVVRAEIAETRAELADTVDALTEKLDVKQHAADKVADAKQKVAETAAKAKPHRGKIVAALAVGAVVLVVVRRKRAER